MQLEEPSGIEIETPINEILPIDLLEGMAKRTLQWLIGLNLVIEQVYQSQNSLVVYCLLLID